MINKLLLACLLAVLISPSEAEAQSDPTSRMVRYVEEDDDDADDIDEDEEPSYLSLSEDVD